MEGGQFRRVTLKSLGIFLQSKGAAWSAAGHHSSSLQRWAGGASLEIGEGGVLEGASPGEAASESEEQSRWIQDEFGIHQVDLWRRLQERWRVEPGRTPRFLTEWVEGALTEVGTQHPRLERNSVSAQRLKRNHKSPSKVLIPELFGTFKIENELNVQ